MSIDLSKLTPAPWDTGHRGHRSDEQVHYVAVDAKGVVLFDTINSEAAVIETEYDEARTTYHDPVGRENLEFTALARNAFDVMMRRGWYACKAEDGWIVMDADHEGVSSTGKDFFRSPDPFTALTEADKWFAESFEKGATSG